MSRGGRLLVTRHSAAHRSPNQAKRPLSGLLTINQASVKAKQRRRNAGEGSMAFKRHRGLPQGEVTVEEFRAWLSQFDADHNGRISREELQSALRSLNVWFAWWKARGGVRAADANRDGAVDGDDEVGRLFAFAQRNLHVKISQLGYY